MAPKIEKLETARAGERTFEIATILATLFNDQPQTALNELAMESAFVRVAFVMKVRGITSRAVAAAINTHENYISKCLANQTGLTRKWQQLAQYLRVPQAWLAFGSPHGEPQTTIDAIKGVRASMEKAPVVSSTTPMSGQARRVMIFAPQTYTYTPIKLLSPSFGYPKGTTVQAEPRLGEMHERVILKMKDGSTVQGWIMLPGWQGQSALVAVDNGTNKFDHATTQAIQFDQIKESYVVTGVAPRPLRQPKVRVEYEADLPDDYPDEGADERP